RQLDQRVDITLQGRLLPLREGLDQLSRGYSVAMFLDRRIDPDQLVDYKARDTALESAVQQIAAAAHAETAAIGSVVYVGPRETASQLATMAAMRRQDVAGLPNDI